MAIIITLVALFFMVDKYFKIHYRAAQWDTLTSPLEVQSTYDLIVVGGDPEGVAAAVSGARNGLDVLLVDNRPVLGGLMTRGWLNSIDMNYDPKGKILNKGIFKEFYNRVEGDSFDVQTAVRSFNRLVSGEDNLTVLQNATDLQPIVQETATGENQVVGVKLIYQGEYLEISAPYTIDATQDANIAALSGASFTIGQEDIGRPYGFMAATVVFRLENVNWLDWWKIFWYLRFGDKSYYTNANLHSAWGYSEQTTEYQPTSDRIFLRGLNIGRQNDSSVLINALLVYEVDPLDEATKAEAYSLVENELPKVIDFLNTHIIGLSEATYGGIAPELYVRESRHIITTYRLTIDDVLENRDFDDRIAFGSYPVDIQPSTPGLPGIIVGAPEQYAVPFRCLTPQGVEGLLVVGRAAGFDTLAAGSARTIPVGMAVGQAAGAATALAAENQITFHELAQQQDLIKELQGRLNKQGMNLVPFHITNELADHPAYAGLKFVRGLGLAAGGYRNNYQLDEDIAEQRFINLLSQIVKQTGLEKANMPVLYPEGNTFTLYDASYMLTTYMGLGYGKQEAYDYLNKQGVFKQHKSYFSTYMGQEQPLSHGAAYLLLQEFVEFYLNLETGGQYIDRE